MSYLYPYTDPYMPHELAVGSGHTLYIEECGNKAGIPVLFIHGGPGIGCSTEHRRFFSPEKYRVILFDQRGCGRSTPHASLEANTSQELISDIEKIRIHLNIEKFILFGGSWGSTLSLLYAIHHPSRVLEMVLRGIFLCRRQEIDWFYRGVGTAQQFPDYHKDYMSLLVSDDKDPVVAYYDLLTSSDENVRKSAAIAWSLWEARTSTLIINEGACDFTTQINVALSMARIECHYFINNIFFAENFILDNLEPIKDIETHIVHGRYDSICPITNAFELHENMNNSTLHVIDAAGHSASEPGVGKMLVNIMDAER